MDKTATQSQTNSILSNREEETITTFEDLGLKPDLLRGIYAYGLLKPSPVQCRAIPALLRKKHTVVQARQGDEMTIAYAISILQLVDPNSRNCQAVVLAHSSFMAQEIHKVILALGNYLNISIFSLSWRNKYV